MLNRATSPSTARIQWRYFEGWVSNCSFCAEAGVSIDRQGSASRGRMQALYCLHVVAIMHYNAADETGTPGLAVVGGRRGPSSPRGTRIQPPRAGPEEWSLTALFGGPRGR